MDIADMAQRHEEVNFQFALAGARRAGLPAPFLILDGVRCCVDCEDPIPAGRIEAFPQATRCLACQQALERRAVR